MKNPKAKIDLTANMRDANTFGFYHKIVFGFLSFLGSQKYSVNYAGRALKGS